MLVTELGIVMQVRPEQLVNALGEILIVPSLISIDVLAGISPLYSNNTSFTYITPSDCCSYHGVPSKALKPIFVTELGIVMLVRFEQY